MYWYFFDISWPFYFLFYKHFWIFNSSLKKELSLLFKTCKIPNLLLSDMKTEFVYISHRNYSTLLIQTKMVNYVPSYVHNTCTKPIHRLIKITDRTLYVVFSTFRS